MRTVASLAGRVGGMTSHPRETLVPIIIRYYEDIRGLLFMVW